VGSTKLPLDGPALLPGATPVPPTTFSQPAVSRCGPWRLRPAPAAAGDLALREGQLRGPQRHRPGSSVLRFIDDNWNLGCIGDDVFDAKAGSFEKIFDFLGHSRPDALQTRLVGHCTAWVAPSRLRPEKSQLRGVFILAHYSLTALWCLYAALVSGVL
jgi:hypothetical protein